MVYDDDKIVLERNPLPSFHHKREEDDWLETTGIRYSVNQSKAPTQMIKGGLRAEQETIRMERLRILQEMLDRIRANGQEKPNWNSLFIEFNDKVVAKCMPQLKFPSVGMMRTFYSLMMKSKQTSSD